MGQSDRRQIKQKDFVVMTLGLLIAALHSAQDSYAVDNTSELEYMNNNTGIEHKQKHGRQDIERRTNEHKALKIDMFYRIQTRNTNYEIQTSKNQICRIHTESGVIISFRERSDKHNLNNRGNILRHRIQTQL